MDKLEKIQTEYNLIKNSKLRNPSMLKKLGEILSATYKLSPQEADTMWQNIINLNTEGNISLCKFYIAQVFNKVADHLSSHEATDFVFMNPNRVRQMYLYGYDGTNLYRCAAMMIKTLVSDSKFEECINIVSYNRLPREIKANKR